MTQPLAKDLKKSDFIILDHTLDNGELPHGYIQIHYNGTREDAERDIVEPLLELKQLKERIEDKIKNLNINLQFCSTQGLTWEIIKSNIRFCESILKGDSTN